MKKLVIGAAAAGGTAFAVSQLVRKGGQMHDHCREMMRDCCSGPSGGRQSR
jgi:hypothetical protein